MISLSQKIEYFMSSLGKFILRKSYECPSCGSTRSSLIERKFLVTSLRRCEQCSLLYRAPTTSVSEYASYYQEDYSEGFTTDLPSDAELQKLKENNFLGSGKDYSSFIQILKTIGYESGESILDYGCSWGYGSWQFSKAGLNVIGYEVSRNRCAFARDKLDVNAYSDLSQLRNIPKVKFFFSSHVLEHIPQIKEVIQLARDLVMPGGYFIAFTPNGSMDYRSLNPAAWSKVWGFVHPLFIDPAYYEKEFISEAYLIDSGEYNVDAVKEWVASQFSQSVLKTNGPELMIIAKL